MPLETETVDLAAEVDRLESEMADVAEEHANWEGKPAYAQNLMQRGRDLERYCNALEWLGDEYDIDAVALQGLTAGDRNVANDVADGHDNLMTAAYVAVGTRDAPWLAHEPETPGADLDAVKETTIAVNDLPPGVLDWADERIGDLTHLREDTGNGYMDLLAEKMQTGETPEPTSG